ncbi:MAG: ATP-binding protein [Kangiellaceae bacterium]|nr:ATP-binding protein [Kangiellaceae bacterium]MCW8998429.1 ATP-binding protein [Kangiellaceae bacterium]
MRLNWLSKLSEKFSQFKQHANEQAKLVLLASLPCYFLAIYALRAAGASWSFTFFCAIVLGLVILYAAVTGKRKANYHIQTLSNLVEAMIDGDYTLRGRKQSNPAFQELLDLINQLADTLNQHKIQAEESQLLLEKIINQMDALLIAADENGEIAIVNQSAQKILKLQSGNDNAYSLQDLNLSQLEQARSSDIIRIDNDEFSGEFILYKDKFISNNKVHSLYFLTRAEKLLREKEKQAWQSLLRVLSHELNNSLTPISTFSSTLLRKLDKDQEVNNVDKFRKGLGVIRERADSLSQFISSYSQLSHLPSANPSDYRWKDDLRNLAQLFPECKFNYNLGESTPDVISADKNQVNQVLVNLIKNASESMQELESKQINIEAHIQSSTLKISISDQGSGIANSENLFVPFYSTKSDGSGIGLVLCQQIMLNHNGDIRLANREDDKGAKATISLPL